MFWMKLASVINNPQLKKWWQFFAYRRSKETLFRLAVVQYFGVLQIFFQVLLPIG